MERNKVNRFEDLIIWQESLQLSIEIYSQLKSCKDWGLKDQMQRSAVSVPSNIAEGFERRSNKSFIHYLNISNGSLGELRTQLYIAINIGVISKEAGELLIHKSNQISSLIYKLIKTRKAWEAKKSK